MKDDEVVPDKIDELLKIIEEGTELNMEDADPIVLLSAFAELLDFDIALLTTEANDKLSGVVIGTPAFLETNIVDLDDFTIFESDTKSENDLEI